MTDNSLAVHVQNAYKQYGNNQILKNLTLRVPKGSIYGLLGASGCGKTTLLNCIVNRTSLNSGTIQVLGDGPRILGPRVGYMPQEMALVGELTVEDTLYYFGRIFNLSENQIEEKLVKLMNLLNLPPRNRYIRNCSGGEQRRISFAVSMVHTPDLLILDEPTVGVDSLLREKIWNYLVELTANDDLAVIITTHYIEEARQAQVVGMMRDGRLLAEEPPTALLNRFQADVLGEVFLLLCQQQNNETSRDLSVENSGTPISNTKQAVGQGGGYSLNQKRMKALLSKNAKQLYRNYVGIIFMLFFPLATNVGFLVAFGPEVQGIKLAIVNEETFATSCPNNSLTTVTVIKYDVECHHTNLSCRFLDYLDYPMFEKVKYDSLAEALDSVNKGEVGGVLHMAKNFTESFEKRVKLGSHVKKDVLSFSQVKVWLDMSSYPIGQPMKDKLYTLYKDFAADLMKDCKVNPRVGDFFNTTMLYGSDADTFTEVITPGMTLIMVAFMMTMVTSQIVLTERTEGFWDRSIIAGVSALELVLAHFMTQTLTIMVYTVQFVVVTFVIFQMKMVGSLWVIAFMIFLQGIYGFGLGFWISIVCRNTTASTSLTQGIFYLQLLICGLMWPIEGMPLVLQYISQLSPITLPITAFRNVMKKGWSLTNFTVLSGVIVEIIWIVIFVVVDTVLLKLKR